MTVRWLAQVASIVLCAAVTFGRFLGLDGTEFSGGWLSGPILQVHFGGTLLLTFALVVAFVYPRAAAVMTLAAVACCLPLYLFFLVPGMFPGVRSIPVRSYFEFNVVDFWSVFALAFATLVAVWTLRTANRG